MPEKSTGVCVHTYQSNITLIVVVNINRSSLLEAQKMFVVIYKHILLYQSTFYCNNIIVQQKVGSLDQMSLQFLMTFNEVSTMSIVNNWLVKITRYQKEVSSM